MNTLLVSMSMDKLLMITQFLTYSNDLFQYTFSVAEIFIIKIEVSRCRGLLMKTKSFNYLSKPQPGFFTPFFLPISFFNNHIAILLKWKM